MGGLPPTSSRQLLQCCSIPLQHHQSSALPSLAAFGSAHPRRQAQLARCASGSRSAKRQAKAASRTAEPALSSFDHEAGSNGRSDREHRKAVAAKISAARALARKLAEEKQAAVNAARLAAEHTMDEEEIEALKANVESATASAAREAARADAVARAARMMGPAAVQSQELDRLKAENEALQQLVLEVADNKQAAQEQVARLREKFANLVAQVGDSQKVQQRADRQQQEADAAKQRAEEAQSRADHAPSRQQEVENVVRGLVMARERLQQEGTLEGKLKALAKAATGKGRAFFTLPEDGCAVGETATVYYDRRRGPLPEGARPALKAGLNAWESLVLLDMTGAEGLEQAQGEWWAVDVELPKDVFSVSFVINDATGAAVDNNRGKDFTLPLANAPTKDEVHDMRAAQAKAWEEHMHQAIAQQEAALWDEMLSAAGTIAEDARRRYKEAQQAQLRTDAAILEEERRSSMVHSIHTEPRREGVFDWPGGPPSAGKKATFVYNKQSSPLASAQDAVLHLGVDGWWERQKDELPLRRLTDAKKSQFKLPDYGDWWGVDIQVDAAACVLDFVLSDSAHRAWDNNGMKDYHTAVEGALHGDGFVRLLLDQHAQEGVQQGAERAAQSAVRKLEIKAKAARKRRELQRQVLFSDPLQPTAGQAVDVYYNPDATVLRGRPDVWLRGGWNRWNLNAHIAPQQLQPVVPGGVGFLKATVQIPKEAAVMDLVFSDSGEAGGGFFDNNNGLEYHFPITGSSSPQPSLFIVHVSVEMAPIAKVGGMGDVVTALGRAVQEEGHRVEVILPKFDCINYKEVHSLTQTGDFFFNNIQVKVWRGEVEGLPTTFLEPCNGSVWAGCIYGRNDDAARFAVFCGAALEFLRHHCQGQQPGTITSPEHRTFYDHKLFLQLKSSLPDVIHCHDWPTAPVTFGDTGRARSVFTIHNLNFGADLIGRAMGASAVGTTVSPTYAVEISGHPAVAPNMSKFYGIINGIDMDIWDPQSDEFMPMNFGPEDAAKGKAAAKAELRARMNLSSAGVPLVGVVTRLTHQKGIHLIKHAAWRTLERGGQFVLLGSAPDPRVQGEFNALAGELGRQYPDRARLWFAYDEPLSHLIYAGCDMFLVPSMFEPCGLTQMIAMRYGTVPVVRKTGGLNDTVFDVDDDVERAAASGMETNGYSFEGTDAAGLDYALNRALGAWYNDERLWSMLVQRIMQQDWSWANPALDYIELYFKALHQ